jgi:hypothetical protein
MRKISPTRSDMLRSLWSETRATIPQHVHMVPPQVLFPLPIARPHPFHLTIRPVHPSLPRLKHPSILVQEGEGGVIMLSSTISHTLAIRHREHRKRRSIIPRLTHLVICRSLLLQLRVTLWNDMILDQLPPAQLVSEQWILWPEEMK